MLEAERGTGGNRQTTRAVGLSSVRQSSVMWPALTSTSLLPAQQFSGCFSSSTLVACNCTYVAFRFRGTPFAVIAFLAFALSDTSAARFSSVIFLLYGDLVWSSSKKRRDGL